MEMGILTWQMIVLAICGMLLHAGAYVMRRAEKKNNKFSFKVWFKDAMNWVRIGMAIISTGALLLMAEDIAAWFGVTVEGHGGLLNIVSFAAGYLNHYLIKVILNRFKKKAEPTTTDNGDSQ